MADELLTVLLQLKGDTKDIKAALADVERSNEKVGRSAKKAGEEQESAFKKMRDGVIGARAKFGEFTGALGAGRMAFGLLSGAADSFAAKNAEAGKKWKEANAAVSEGLDKVQQAIGGIVVALSPLIGLLGKVAGAIGDVAIGVSELLTGGGNNREGVMDNADLWRALLTGTSAGEQASINMRLADARKRLLDNSDDGTYDPDTGLYIKAGGWGAVKLSGEYGPKKPKRRGGGRGIEVDDYTGPRIGDSMFGRQGHDFWGDEAARQAPWAVDAYGRSSAGDTTGLGGMGTGGAFPGADQLASANAAMDALVAKTQGETIMERMFGTVDHIDGYAVAFDGISNAVTSAYDAWVDGSMSVGAAIKASLALSIKSMGAEMAISALKETALGFGSLAWGPLGKASAAAHFKSAGLFAIGAAAAGVAAKGLSGGGAGVSNPSMGGGYGSNLGGGGSSQGGGNRSVTVVLGDGAAGDSSRWRARRVGKAIGAARREMGGDWVTAS